MNGARWRWSWPAFPGPVFRRELGSSSRGWWSYTVRAAAAAAIAAYVFSSVPFREALTVAGEWSPSLVAMLATRSLREFEAAQFVLVLALTPLLVAGSVAEEKARGTLGLILAGRLGSLEIVGDKLAARLLLVLVVMAAGLPVLALIGMLGGIDPVELGVAYGLTLTSAWCAATMAMLVSVHARSASGAVVGAYLAGGSWILLPYWFASWLGRPGPPGLLDWLRPAARWASRTSPLSFAYPIEVWGPWTMTPAGRASIVGEMAGLHLMLGLALFGLAAWRLRPVYRAQVGGVRSNRLAWLARLLGLQGRGKPPCGDAPMTWKERHAPESAWIARLALLAGAGLAAHFVRFLLVDGPSFLNYAFDEMFIYGLDIGTYGAHGGQRAGLNTTLCTAAATLFGASVAASTILAASGVAGERARGTWSGLLGTPIDRREILRAKAWEAVRSVRWLLGLMLCFYLASLASTAMHPVGFVLVTTAGAAFLWFAVALGTWVSVRSKNAAQAIVRTAVLLAAACLVPVAALAPFFGNLAFAFTPPVLMSLLAMSRMHVRSLWIYLATQPAESAAIFTLPWIAPAYAAGAWWLMRSAARRVERDEG